MKDVKVCNSSDKKNKVVVKHHSGAKTKGIESYIIPTLEQNPETVILNCGTNNLKKLHEISSNNIL